jgi:hypothetical protein
LVEHLEERQPFCPNSKRNHGCLALQYARFAALQILRQEV